MQVFEYRENGLIARQILELSQERFKCALLAKLWGQFRNPAVRRGRQRQQVRQQREILLRRSRRQQRLELSQFRGSIVLPLEARGASGLRNDRMERAVPVVRRAQVTPPGMRLRLEAIFQRGGEARLADALLAAEQDDASFALAYLAPTMQQKCKLFIAPEQRNLAAGAQNLATGAQRLEAAVGGTLAQHDPGADRPRIAFHLPAAVIAVIEQSTGQTLRAVGDDHRSGLGERLQACGQIGRVADHRLLE